MVVHYVSDHHGHDHERDHDYVHEHDDVRPLHDDSDDVPHILLFQR